MWDGRIGRWLSPDPYGQYHSPYNGMGNDPINGIDHDGGYRTWLGALGGWIAGGFKGSIDHVGGKGNKNYAISNYEAGNGALDSDGSFIMGTVRRNYGKDIPPMLIGAYTAMPASARLSDLPKDFYIEANASVTRGQLGGGVRFLGTRLEAKAHYAKAPIYQLGFTFDTSEYDPNDVFKNTSSIAPVEGTTYGFGLAAGAGASGEFDIKTNNLKEITTSLFISELTTEFYARGIHAGKIKRFKQGINIGVDFSAFVGIDLTFKAGFIMPVNNK